MVLYSDIDYRRRLELGSKRPHDEPGSPSFGLSGLGIADSETPTSPRAAGWTTFAFQAIGGVVGKVWEFCRGGTGTFRGFQAGGGKPYEPNGQPAPDPTPTVDTNHFFPDTPVGFEEQEVPISPPDIFPNVDMISPNPDSIPVHHDHDYNRDQAQREVLQGDEDRQLHREPSPVQEKTPERPAVKRRRTSINGENDELRRHWVMVEDDEPPSAPLVHRPALTTKRSSAASPAASRLPTSGRSNLVSRLQPPRITPTNTPSRRISAPSPRFGLGSEQKSGIPPPRATSRLSFGSNASYAGLGHSPSLVTGDIASFASPRSPQQPETPVLSPTGSRIPQPRGFGPNPFAATRTASPVPRATPSRPSSRQSMQPSPLAPSLTPSFIPKSTPTHGHHSGHRRSISSVSAGRKSGINVQASPRLDQQAKQLVTKRMAVEKKTDSRLDRLNGELQALIRQGQEALGTNFDVEMDEDERWEEA
ncbi:hypothetical protein SLS53_004334 [Cytospora paraplurivora]|uniref:Uncharacterized protein n=1 Tax=Cytospora paraplurivora TaxID=2898453 RepID=A0AAN9UFQ9_9PEZI